jgi:hypothetical protein
MDINNTFIPTYVINLSFRKDRLFHIQKQFQGRQEFDLMVIEASQDERSAKGLWKSIVRIIEMAQKEEHDVIIICEDDHEFTGHYDKELLIENIINAYIVGMDLLLGGVSDFGKCEYYSKNQILIDWFYGTQFLILFKSFYSTIVNANFDTWDTADGKLSELTYNKSVIFPFISVQKDFGYSDIFGTSRSLNEVSTMFEDAFNRMKSAIN